MHAYKTSIPDILILHPNVYSDDRGSFFESFNYKLFCDILVKNNNINSNPFFVQDNHSVSKLGVLRGLHYQIKHPQGKLVRVVSGSAFDVVVDLRKTSATFGQSFGIELNQNNNYQLWIPPGFAHGFLALSEHVEFLYKTTEYRYPEYECSIIWNDEFLNINWPTYLLPNQMNPILSDKDAAGLNFNEADVYE
jgi:dTDP-4-dehydrorhamnose 3,5-epimerase